MTSTDNMNISRPPQASRQIGEQHWMTAANILEMEQKTRAIVSCHYSGWVYLMEQTNQDNVFRCMTYKLGVDPFKIKKDLYNFTINNGQLIEASFYNTSE